MTTHTPQLLFALVLAATVTATGCGRSPGVRAWQGTRTIPTYEEGAPDPNPPFDLFAGTRFNYPYTIRQQLTDRRAMRAWRTLNLENEYLRVAVLPDLGGHVLSVVDKANGREMFYANPSLKFAQVAYRGAWASYGIEFNFPVSHSWVTVSPVDFAEVKHADGSASIVVASVDLVYEMQWRVELTLRPGRSVLEQRTTLYNRSDARHRFYWWTNAAVEVWDDSQLVYPMTHTASHGFADVDTWPVNAAGVDLSRPGNHLYGPVSLFSHGSREPFMGVYHPRTRAGVVHYSSSSDLPAKKIWSWGGDADGLEWRKALSDNDSAVAEVQAGLYRNQETYAFLEPQESIRFTEYWLPVRAIGGISRATPDAVLHVSRKPESKGGSSLVVGINVTRAIARGRVQVLDGTRTVADDVIQMTPSDAVIRTYSGVSARPHTVRLVDREGHVVIEHTDGRYDVDPPESVKTGAQPGFTPPPPGERGAADFVEIGRAQELEGKILTAYRTYEDGRRRYPANFELAKAAGRLAVALKRFDDALPALDLALSRVSNDAEAQYYLACALVARGDSTRARVLFEAAAHARSMRAASTSQLARLAARERRRGDALSWIQEAVRADSGAVRNGAFEVILLRRAGQLQRALQRARHWMALDPTNATLRVEMTRLGGDDRALWSHLGADPQRVLDVAVDYMELGDWPDAADVLGRNYPAAAPGTSEPGAVTPQRHPEIAYYRGYCRERARQSGLADFEAASRLSTQYVFPHRAATLPVLQKALEANPADNTARFLLGSLYLSGGMASRAVEEWEIVRRTGRSVATLDRNLGMTLLYALREPEQAAAVLSEGIAADPRNPDVYLALDQALSLMQRPTEERLRALDRYPDVRTLPPPLVFKRALGLVETGRFDEAEKSFEDRFFPREEFGTNVRQVYVEVMEQKALGLARRQQCAAATGIVRHLGDPVARLPFTQAGMSAFAEVSRTQYLAGEVFAACGDRAEARARWEEAAAGKDAYPYPNVFFAWQARQRLSPAAMDQATRSQFETALASWERRLTIGTNFPGPNACGRGLILRALGREQEARERFQEALLLPDQLMSHFLARAALRGVGL